MPSPPPALRTPVPACTIPVPAWSRKPCSDPGSSNANRGAGAGGSSPRATAAARTMRLVCCTASVTHSPPSALTA